MAESKHQGSNRRTWFVVITLIVLFMAALFLRAYWNSDAAVRDGDFVLSGGSDPYYHKRAVDAIQENGFRTLIDDPLLNYPLGSVNPNPPLFEWSIAVAGQLASPFFDDVATSTWWATLYAPAVYGALTLIPIYFIAAALFDRRAGLIAATLWTLSTTAIQTGGVGQADHDAAVMFFTSLTFLFYIKMVHAFRGNQKWVSSWSDGSAVSRGLGRLFRERRSGLAYAYLAAMGVASVALIWKGFPYVLGILFAYAGLQLIVDHWRSRDATGVFVGTLIAMLIGTLVAYPYYAQAGVANFLRPVWFIIGAFFVAGAVLVPTRDLPTILVFPAALLVAAVGLIVAFFVVPEVATSLLYATVYFKQTALYETIAEAHPADFSTIIFGIGPLPFLFALGAWVTLLFTIKKHPQRAILFALVWGAVALFMAQSAVRFLFNAIPVFVVFAARGLTWTMDWVDFKKVRKALAANPGNMMAGLRKGMSGLHYTFVILIALLLVMPNVMLAADAALPREVEVENAAASDSTFVKNFYESRLGAFGQGFIADYWIDGLQWLDEHDAHIANAADRPAFLSWWDYGHWAIAIGHHPAVADNFQNGYEFAANFILAGNETHAIQLLAARTAVAPGADVQAALTAAGSADPAGDAKKLMAWQFVPTLDAAQSVQLLLALEGQTGKSIRYFAVDIRMLPYDNPQTSYVEQSSIFYAPVTLKGDDPDDYVETQINAGRQTVDGTSEDGWVDSTEFERLASDPIRPRTSFGERLVYKEPFFNSMYYRSYVGTPPQDDGSGTILGSSLIQALSVPQPTLGMTYFRLAYTNDALRIIEFTPGAIVTGQVSEDGAPAEGVSIAVYDDAGADILATLDPGFAANFDDPSVLDVRHATTTTDTNGNYRVVAPFSMAGQIRVVATRDGVELGTAALTISRSDAAQQQAFTGDIVAELGSLAGQAFHDVDGNGAYTPANDTLLTNMSVTIEGRTVATDENGNFTMANLPAGSHTITVGDPSYEPTPAAASVTVKPGETTQHALALRQTPASVTGRLFADLDGSGTYDAGEEGAFTAITFAPAATSTTARENTAFSQADGNYTVTLRPGSYDVTANFTHDASGDLYEVNATLTVVAAEVRDGFELIMTKA